jgi:uncharacterized phage protein (TIGR02216 family)
MKFFGEVAATLAGIAGQLLGWRPDEFWSATPAELSVALRPLVTCEAPDRKTFEELRRRFPD